MKQESNDIKLHEAYTQGQWSRSQGQ